MKKKKAFTIIEILVSLVVIGILSTLAVTQYGSYRERILDREAAASLKLMQQAQRVYQLENIAYYPIGSASQSNIASINNNLKLFLNEQYWDYITYSGGASGAGTSTATRSGRTWALPINDVNASCTGSCL